jgi:hypothetical protein
VSRRFEHRPARTFTAQYVRKDDLYLLLWEERFWTGRSLYYSRSVDARRFPLRTEEWNFYVDDMNWVWDSLMPAEEGAI